MLPSRCSLHSKQTNRESAKQSVLFYFLWAYTHFLALFVVVIVVIPVVASCLFVVFTDVAVVVYAAAASVGSQVATGCSFVALTAATIVVISERDQCSELCSRYGKLHMTVPTT